MDVKSCFAQENVCAAHILTKPLLKNIQLSSSQEMEGMNKSKGRTSRLLNYLQYFCLSL